MKKFVMIGSLAFSVVFYGYYVLTGEEAVLAYILLGLLASFVCAMLFLAEK